MKAFARIFLLVALIIPTFMTPSIHGASSDIVISQFRTRGPNGEMDDFIELFNRSTEIVNIGNWRVHVIQTRSINQLTIQMPTTLLLIPGAHYLIVGPGYSGQARSDQAFPGMPDNVSIGLLDSAGGRVDAVATDFGFYEEGQPLRTIVVNEDWSYKRRSDATGNYVDTDHNMDDFRLIRPSDPQGLSLSLLSGFASAAPATVSPGSTVLLMVEVRPGSVPPSTGLQLTADLSSIGGPSSQVLYDDGTHGDVKPADLVFTYAAEVAASTGLGTKAMPLRVSDSQGRDITVYAFIDVQLSPHPQPCSQERAAVKTGADVDAAKVTLNQLEATTIASLRAIARPPVLADDRRALPVEATVYVLTATLTQYRSEDDADYHLVLRDESGNTMVARIPCLCCVGSLSPFASLIASARSEFDKRFAMTGDFQTANIPVQITGLGFFDLPHDQTGAAPNQIELHPVLDIKFDVNLHTPVIVGAAVSGKKLFVSGLNFDNGAKVYIGSAKQKTVNVEEAPTTQLRCKKAGKNIAPGQTVLLTVHNADGMVSEPFRLN